VVNSRLVGSVIPLRINIFRLSLNLGAGYGAGWSRLTDLSPPWTPHEPPSRAPSPSGRRPAACGGTAVCVLACLRRPSGSSGRPRRPSVHPRCSRAFLELVCSQSPSLGPRVRIQSPWPVGQRFSSTRFPRRARSSRRGAVLREAHRILEDNMDLTTFLRRRQRLLAEEGCVSVPFGELIAS
jgi:hypothetical protein